MAQLIAQTAHNGLVVGLSPTGSTICDYGGIGRHEGLKILWMKIRESSSLSSRIR
jgi:hypothetical protein